MKKKFLLEHQTSFMRAPYLFPEKRFFIHHDDTEYSLRLVTLGKILMINDSLIYHKEKRQEEKIERKFLCFRKNRSKTEFF